MKRRKINRRDFLNQLALTVPGAYLLGCAPKAFTRSPASQDSAASGEIFDCIVIGAGVSGLTVAHELLHSPATGDSGSKIVVLEASSRIGGRVWTDRSRFRGEPVELGAEYVHLDPKHAFVWRDINNFGFKTTKISKLNGYMYHPKNPEHPGKLKTVTGAAMSWNIIKALTVWGSFKMDMQKPDISAAQFLTKKVIPTHDAFAYDFKDMILTGHLGATEEDLSMRGFQSDRIVKQLEYEHEFYVHWGYDNLPKALAQGVDVRFSQTVSRITYGKDHVTVETTDGSLFKGKCAVITASVGVVKSGNIEFSPALPDEKLAAIESLQMSYHSKVQMEFTKRFWPEKMSMFHRPDQARKAGKTYFVGIPSTPTSPPILTALIMGPDEKRLLHLSDEEILADIFADLDPAFPDAGGVAKVLARREDGSPSILVTHWNKNPLVGGGVSFVKYGFADSIAPEKVRETYANGELTPGLFWAGEASSTFEQASSVHGAHSAGIRAAIEVRNYISTGQNMSQAEIGTAYNKQWNGYLESLSRDQDDNG